MLPALSPNARGILAMVAGMAVFTANDATMKLALVKLPVGQATAVRGVIALTLSLGLVVGMGHWSQIRTIARPIVALRAICETLGALAFFTALKGLTLADLVAITQSSPLNIAAYCAVSGLAPMGPRRWAAVLVGFIGVLIVAEPVGHSDPMMGVALLAAAFVAARDIVTRKIPAGIPSMLVLCSTSLAVLIGGLVMGASETWQPLDLRSLGLLATAAVLVNGGHFLLIVAFRGVDMAVVSPFRYSVMIWAIIAGYLVFGTSPSAMTLAGAALIAGSGLYTVHRERVLARRAAGT
jgi:drug/metabolite transporter (DMT)-like permease